MTRRAGEGRVMGRLKNMMTEWRSRRAGARHAPAGIQQSARDVIGPIGAGFSNAWDTLAEGSKAYVDSFDRRLPPSTFVSERDRTRFNQPIPLVERRIEAFRGDDGLTPEEVEWGRHPPGADADTP